MTQVFTVTIPADSGPGTLRDAIGQADLLPASAGSAEIDFDLGGAATIGLTSGPLELSNATVPIVIHGPGAASLTLCGNDADQVFRIDPDVTSSLSGLTISGGSTTSLGGGLYNQGQLSLTDVTISGHTAGDPDLGIFGSGGGSGLYNAGTGSATLTDCTLSGNFGFKGGAIFNKGSMTLSGSPAAGDTAMYGGGLMNTGEMTLSNCSVIDNSGPFGASADAGGLMNSGQLYLRRP